MEDDWDLQAVVRGCTTTTTSTLSYTSTTTSAAPTTCCGGGGGNLSFFLPPQEECEFGASNLFSRNGGIDDLHELYKPFFPKKPSSPKSIPISPLSVLQDLSQQMEMEMEMTHQQQQQQVLKPKHNLSMAVHCRTKEKSNVNSRSKRRKTQMKKVIEIPAESLSSDMWSWRKYGQKPIKGSPYPRGYYKCSTSKGCLARKQVERNRSDPGIFIVTYTAEHNHPMPTHKNSLAGISRQKQATTSSGGGGGEPSCSSPPVSPNSLSFSSEQAHDMYLETESSCKKDPFLEDVNLEDDFFEGLEELEDVSPASATATAGGVSDTFPQSGQLCWLTKNSMTTTTATEGV